MLLAKNSIKPAQKGSENEKLAVKSMFESD